MLGVYIRTYYVNINRKLCKSRKKQEENNLNDRQRQKEKQFINKQRKEIEVLKNPRREKISNNRHSFLKVRCELDKCKHIQTVGFYCCLHTGQGNAKGVYWREKDNTSENLGFFVTHRKQPLPTIATPYNTLQQYLPMYICFLQSLHLLVKTRRT